MYKIDFSKPTKIHFIGIGGISMSGLAEILLKEGFSVSGSDSKESPLRVLVQQLLTHRLPKTSLPMCKLLSTQQQFIRITRNLHTQKS